MTMTAKEAALKWGLSLRSVQNHCKNGAIPGARRFGRTWMIPADAPKPEDRRRKENPPPERRLLRQSPFLDMTDLYREPGSADRCIEELADYPETQVLFAAAIRYSRGDIDAVHRHARALLNDHTEFYAVVSGGILLSLVAMWKGDVPLWNEARRHLLEAPCRNEVDTDIVALSIAAADSAIRNTEDFPDWFARGCFDKLPPDAHPAARVYYVKRLLVAAQELAMGRRQFDDAQGLALIRTIPYVIEPMISQTVVEGVVLAEIYLRLLCAVAYRQGAGGG